MENSFSVFFFRSFLSMAGFIGKFSFYLAKLLYPFIRMIQCLTILLQKRNRLGTLSFFLFNGMSEGNRFFLTARYQKKTVLPFFFPEFLHDFPLGSTKRIRGFQNNFPKAFYARSFKVFFRKGIKKLPLSF